MTNRLNAKPRDYQILEALHAHRVLTDTQLQILLFSPSNGPGCRRRLVELYRNHWIDRLARRSVNDPYVYLLSRKSIVGNRILRTKLGDEAFRAGLTRVGSVPHLLAVNDVRVRVEKAASGLGWDSPRWRTSEQLAPRLKPFGLIPDGQFTLNGKGWMIELERSVKASQYLNSKIAHYADLFSSPAYENAVINLDLKVLMIFTNEPMQSGDRRASRVLEQANKLSFNRILATSMDTFSVLNPDLILTSPIWMCPIVSGNISLYL